MGIVVSLIECGPQPLEHSLATLPIVILFGGTVAIWALKKRSLRFRWALASVAAFLAILSSVFVVNEAPIRISISVWRPLDIFSTQIQLLLDSANSRLIIAATAVLLAVLLSEVVRIGEEEISIQPMKLAYTGLAIMALLSANILTVALSWALMDLVKLIYGLQTSDENSIPELLAHVTVDWLSVFAIIGAAIANGVSGGVDDLDVPLAGNWALIFLIVAVVFRLGVFAPKINSIKKQNNDNAFPILFGLLSPALGLPILARQLAFGVGNGLMLGLRIGSAFGLIVIGLRWMLDVNAPERPRFLIQSVAFLGILAASVNSNQAVSVLMAAVVVMMMVGSLESIWIVYTPWQRVFPMLAGLMLLIPAWSPGALIVQSFGEGFEAIQNSWVSILGILGLAMVVVGILRKAYEEIQPWFVDDLARSIYAIALMLPIIGGFGLSVGTGTGIGLWAVVVSVVVVGFSVLGIFLIRRMDERLGKLIQGGIMRVNFSPVLKAANTGTQWLLKGLRTVGGIFEGEGAMLWIFVILLLLQLGSGLGS